ncbi:regulator of microtubule dynamics protein 1-like [Sycon ciliatum]|uniref:regulator of microtubule dynamics protein 1-like n=1 Tax=Sycon ciliatum TaxID=27933 RepID=UPI0020ADF426|eukprot:scpid61192/ scgid7412/ Regulator of microtubule dynamics protein 1; Protein FAM82B
MDWSRSVYVAGFAGVAVGLGGALVYVKASACKAGPSVPEESNLIRLATAVDGLSRQLSNIQESLGSIEQALKERSAAARAEESEDSADGPHLSMPLSHSQRKGSEYSLASAMQSDAFDTAEEDHTISSDEEDPDSLESFLDRIDALHAKKDNMSVTQKEIFQLLTDRVENSPEDCHLLWRYARAHKTLSDLAKAAGDTEEQKRLIYAGVDLGKRALAVDDKRWQAHQWYAILVGLTSAFESTQAKIANGKIFKEHVDRAIELNSSDYSLYHLLAQWCYAVAGLTWIERNAAKMLYGEPPKSSYDEALSNFREAERLYTGKWKNNKLMIAKCFYGMSNYAETRQWLEEAKETPIVTEEDRTSQVEIEELLLKV